VSVNFIDNSITIYERLLNLRRVREVLTEAEEQCKVGRNPFEHITKLLAIVSKSPNPESMIWVVETLWDMTKVKNFPEPPSLRAFSGQMSGSGGKGLVELQSFKMEMRKYFTADALIPRNWATDVKTTIQNVFDSLESYRFKCGYPNNLVKDQTWRAGWPESADAYFRLVEAVVFTDAYDAVLKVAVKSRKSPSETMKLDALAELVADIDEGIVDEGKAAIDEATTTTLEINDDDVGMDAAADDDADGGDAADVQSKGHTALDKLEAFAARTASAKMNLSPASELIKEMAAHALRLIQTHVIIIVEDGLSDDELATAIAGSVSGSYHCNSKQATATNYSCIVFDSKLLGESSSDAHLRMPPTPPTRVKRLIQAAIKARYMSSKQDRLLT
jgi:hypothetical protein